MFTGIIEAAGRVVSFRRLPGGGGRLTIAAPFAAELAIGESVAVDGTCLTVIAPARRGNFEADLSPETLERTTMGRLTSGSGVNLERALAASGRLGGHIVQGHVDAVTRVTAIRNQKEFAEYRFAIPKGGSRYLVEKGPVALDGISLTVASLGRRDFGVAVIPKTLEETVLKDRIVGAEVNVEFDILGKYVERMLAGRVGRGS